jgi:starch-binding outer membrane protein, SusD/RagB family
MKKIIIILGIIASVFSSCSDYIEEESLSYPVADETYRTSGGFQLLVNSTYARLKEIYGGNPWFFVGGTDLYAEGFNPESPLSDYKSLTPASTNVEELYVSCYSQIQSVNKVLYYSTITEPSSNLNALVGEARFLRANAYFLLVQAYGGVPIANDHITSTENTSFSRNSEEEVYNQIIEDLNASLASVGTGAYATTGKVNKRAVNDLLAKVYLTRGYQSYGKPTDFATAAAFADAAIAGQGLTLPVDQLFKPGNDLNAETIFSVQYDKASTSTSPTTLGNRQYSYYSSNLGAANTGAPQRSQNLLPTGYALNLYEQADKRWNSTFMTEIYQGVETTNGVSSNVLYFPYYRSASLSTLKIIHFYEPKWFTPGDRAAYIASHPDLQKPNRPNGEPRGYHRWGEYAAESVVATTPLWINDCGTIPVKKFDDPELSTPLGTGSVSTRDIIVARLADTYLIAAEAYLKAGDPGTGLLRLNAVRTRAGVTGTLAAEFNIDYILDERAREMLGEYNRWFDLKRTGTLTTRVPGNNYKVKLADFGTAPNQKLLRPIPQKAIDLNKNKDFPQNPGY